MLRKLSYGASGFGAFFDHPAMPFFVSNALFCTSSKGGFMLIIRSEISHKIETKDKYLRLLKAIHSLRIFDV